MTEDKAHATAPNSGDQGAQAEILRLKARIAELEHLVVTDTLTPLYNRRYFMEELDRWCWRAHRYGGQYGLLYIDVDNLKILNDSFGHNIGDEMLIAVAKSIKAATRKSDIVARVGGDEFAILLEAIAEDYLEERAEVMRQIVAATHIQVEGKRQFAAASVGAVALIRGMSPGQAMIHADKSMYADKRSRNAATEAVRPRIGAL